MTVTAVDDVFRDRTISSSVVVGINEEKTKDSEYDKLTSKKVDVTTDDNENPLSVTLTPIANVTSISEAAGTASAIATLTVSLVDSQDPNNSLASRKATTVTLGVDNTSTAALGTDYEISSTSITIPAGHTSGTVTVKSKHDLIDEVSESIKLYISGFYGVDNSTGNLNYNDQLLQNRAVEITLQDDDEAGVTISSTSSSIIIGEKDNNNSTFTVKLNSQPTGIVVLNLNDNSSSEFTYSPGSLTFGPDNWSIAQIVTVTSKDNDVDELADNQTSTITVTVDNTTTDDSVYSGGSSTGSSDGGSGSSTGSSDGGSGGSGSTGSGSSGITETITVTTTDNDVAGITIKPNGGISATEGGNNGTFTVELDSRPTGNVVLSIQANAEASVSPATLTFDASSSTDWSTPKTVTITAVDDDVDDGDVSSTITVLVGGSTADSEI